MTRPEKLEILYVDDEPANLRSFKSAFRRLYKVHIADHPSKAMDIVKEKDLKIVCFRITECQISLERISSEKFMTMMIKSNGSY